VDVRGAEGEAVVEQRGVDHGAVLSPLQQVAQVTQVAVAAAHPVARAVLVHDEHLTRAEPTLEGRGTRRCLVLAPNGGVLSESRGKQLNTFTYLEDLFIGKHLYLSDLLDYCFKFVLHFC